jgi:hypothetical protein
VTVAPEQTQPPGAALAPSARGIVREALHLVFRRPRAAMLPLVAVEVPVAVLVAVANALLYLTVFSDEPVATTRGVFSGSTGGPLFVLLVLTAVEALFTQVARAATIVSIAGAVTGRPKSLAAALDPAFTRMGQLLVLIVMVVAILALGFAAIVVVIGFVLLPYLALRTAISFEAFMLEDLQPAAAIRRSWELTRGNVIRLLGMIGLSVLVVALPILVISGLGAVEFGSRTAEVVWASVANALQAILVIPIVAFLTATTTLFYLTIRSSRDERRPARS